MPRYSTKYVFEIEAESSSGMKKKDVVTASTRYRVPNAIGKALQKFLTERNWSMVREITLKIRILERKRGVCSGGNRKKKKR